MDESSFIQKRTIRYYKKKIVPAIKNVVEELEAEGISESIEHATLGSVEFGFDGLKVEHAEIPDEGVSIAFEAPKISIKGNTIKSHDSKIRLVIEGAEIRLRQFEWFYKKDKFPKLKDNGKADCAVRKLRIECVQALDENSNVKIKKLEVKVGNLEIKTSETKASMVYNLIIRSFKQAIKKVLKKVLIAMLTEIFDSATPDILQRADEKLEESAKPKKAPKKKKVTTTTKKLASSSSSPATARSAPAGASTPTEKKYDGSKSAAAAIPISKSLNEEDKKKASLAPPSVPAGPKPILRGNHEKSQSLSDSRTPTASPKKVPEKRASSSSDDESSSSSEGEEKDGDMAERLRLLKQRREALLAQSKQQGEGNWEI